MEIWAAGRRRFVGTYKLWRIGGSRGYADEVQRPVWCSFAATSWRWRGKKTNWINSLWPTDCQDAIPLRHVDPGVAVFLWGRWGGVATGKVIVSQRQWCCRWWRMTKERKKRKKSKTEAVLWLCKRGSVIISLPTGPLDSIALSNRGV